MNRTATIPLLVCAWFSTQTFAQTALAQPPNHSGFFVEAALHYKTFLAPTVEPGEPNGSDTFDGDIYDGFDKSPTFGFSAGAGMDFPLGEHLNLTAGLLYTMRKDVYQRTDPGPLYGSTLISIDNVYRFDYTYHDLQGLVLVELPLDRWTWSAGLRFSTVAYRSGNYTYKLGGINGIPETEAYRTVSQPVLPGDVWATLRAGRRLAMGRLSLAPFAGLSYALSFPNGLYFRIGIKLPLNRSGE